MKILVKRIPEEELVDFAEDFGFSLDKDASSTRIRKAYVKAVLDHPVQVLHRLPFEDIRILQGLQSHPHPSLVMPYCEDLYHQPMMLHLGFAATYYNDDGDEFMQIASDFWKAVEPHLDTVMEDPEVQLRCAAETFVIGLANLYGQVAGRFVVQEWVRLGYAESIEMARETLEEAYKESLRLQWNAIYELESDKNVEDYLFLSYWSWDDDKELKREIKKHRDCLIQLTRDISNMFLVEENGNGFVVVDILVFSHELYLFTDFQFIKNLTSLIVRKRCDVAAQEMLLVRFNLHNYLRF